MHLELTPGTKLASAVCATEVIVVRPPTEPVIVECGGAPMVAVAEADADPAGPPTIDQADGTPLGKRYAHEASGLEVLCTRAGDGSLSVGGERIPLKDAKPLPSSD
jgi:hypothetical protein